MTNYQSLIREVPNFPIEGVLFRDVTPLLQNAEAFKQVAEDFGKRINLNEVDLFVGIESRGFIIGAPVAYQLGKGFVPIRKQNKLPAETIGRDYQLEYGSDRIEIHVDAIQPGERVLLIDDLIATGGTAEAAIGLIRDMGGEVVECCFVIDLPDVGGKIRLENLGCKVFALCEFEGD